jgi:hypothetical protein
MYAHLSFQNEYMYETPNAHFLHKTKPTQTIISDQFFDVQNSMYSSVCNAV